MTYIALCYNYSGLNPDIIDNMHADLVEAFLVAINEMSKPKPDFPGSMNIPPNMLKKIR